MAHSTKHTINSAGGIALRPEATIGADVGVAMRGPSSRALAMRASSSNRPDRLEEILRLKAPWAGFSWRNRLPPCDPEAKSAAMRPLVEVHALGRICHSRTARSDEPGMTNQLPTQRRRAATMPALRDGASAPCTI